MHFEIPQYVFSEAVRLKSSDKATILMFIRWSISSKQGAYNQEKYKKDYFFDDDWWMQDSFEAWTARFPWLCSRTIKRYFKELLECGAIFKRTAGSQINGRVPNFYRPNPDWPQDKNALNDKMTQGGLSAKMSQVECQNVTGLSDKMALISLSKNLTHNPKNPTPPLSADILELAAEWHDFALREMQWTKPPKEWSVESFAQDLAKVMMDENLNIGGMRAVLKFIESGWWVKVITSPRGLFKKNEEGQRRITVILKQMKPKSQRQEEKQQAMSEEEKREIDERVATIFG